LFTDVIFARDYIAVRCKLMPILHLFELLIVSLSLSRLFSFIDAGSIGAKKVDLWSMRNPSEEFEDENEPEEEESYLSCESDLSSDEDEYFTPPQSPVLQRLDSSDEEMNVFEESLEHLEDEKEYSLFIYG
jgi:hypothetical protein